MKVIFVRHSEPDYSMLDQCEAPWEYRGFGRDLAPLTKHGRYLAQEAAKNPLFAQAQVLVSSSVTRALETATYIACHHNLPLLVEPFFHEWRPDLDGMNDSAEEANKAYRLFWENKGELAVDSPMRYETAEQVRIRFLKALENYRQYDTVVIVCHGMLIRQFVYKETIAYCELFEVEL
ncbi:histidine phosphatase family protein [Streptococcus oriscaviae]|uniref:Histidine phosphatase family protein n=1 Tax=Streptococcus oriscaviae TaxID=2781599 RepID=A0ABX7YIV8_9STRE|nr:histidine phosphatase family protein [Streptococcus oriscaviae]QUE53752.1 histidine phosphatase family protein [Streptococcus oriscaviae]